MLDSVVGNNTVILDNTVGARLTHKYIKNYNENLSSCVIPGGIG